MKAEPLNLSADSGRAEKSIAIKSVGYPPDSLPELGQSKQNQMP
jgi:hypothetical protein